MEKPLEETRVLNDLMEELLQEGFKVFSDDVTPIIKLVLLGITNYMQVNKADFKKSACMLLNNKEGHFVAAFKAAVEESDEGNESLSLSIITDEEAYKQETFDVVYEATSSVVCTFVNNFMFTNTKNNGESRYSGGLHFAVPYTCALVLMILFKKALAFLDNITDEDGEFILNIADTILFIMTSDDGKRVISVEPGTNLKKFIKDDKLIQK